MNRKVKQRMDERRRESHDLKQNNYYLNSSNSSNSLMNNYFQSQKVIQSLLENPAGVNEVKLTKSFKIPKKQPVNIQARRCKVEIDGSSLDFGARSQYNNSTSDSRRNPIGRANNFKNSRRIFNNVRGNEKRRFEAERSQGYPVRPQRDSYNDRNEPERFERDERLWKDDFAAKQNEHASGNFEERRRKEDVFAKNDDSIGSIRPRNATYRDEDTHVKHLNVSKRTCLDSPSRRNRFGRRKAETNSKNVPTTSDKARMKNRLYFNEPIDIIIADGAAPNGKISPENVAIFLNEIKESVAKRILTDPTYQTKFIDHRHQDGLLTMTCADDFTSVFLQQKLTEKLSLWPDAKLEWSFGLFKSCFIKLVVPKPIAHLSEFLNICKKTDGRMLTEKWRRIECENVDDDSGKLFKLGIDKQSYEIIKQQGSVVRCGEKNIKIELDPIDGEPEEAKPWKQKKVKVCLKRISVS